MPKAVKSPAKSRAKSNSARSPRKKPSSAAFIDEEAEESDEGVLVDNPVPADSASNRIQTARELFESQVEEGYEEAFINDGSLRDPYDDCDVQSSHGHSLTPPPSPSKTVVAQKKAIRSPAAVAQTEDVIDVASTSEEDLEAMADDDTMFKKPAGVKPSALPPSMLTRSAATKRLSNVPPKSSPPASAAIASSVATKGGPSTTSPPVLNDQLTKFMGDWMSSFMNQHLGNLSSNASSDHDSKALPSTSRTSNKPSSARTDHDALALREGIKKSLHKPKPTIVNQRPRSLSPDWDPPYSGDIMEEVLPRAPPKKATSSRSKGKEKAVDVDTVLSSKGKTKDVVQTSGGASLPRNTPSTPTRKPPSVVSPPTASGTVSSYMNKSAPPVAASSAPVSSSESPLTMAQFLRMSRADNTTTDVQAQEREASPDEAVDTVFLEDLETYKAYFDPSAPCGVFELGIQDPSLQPHYIGLPPLPAMRRILPAYDRDRASGEEVEYTTGGRVKFSSWFDQNPRMLAANSMGAMLFTEANPNFINPSRVSPLRLSTRVSGGSSSTMRLHVDDRVAVCVSAVCCMESVLVAPRKIGAKSERLRKWMSGVFHDQDWERFESIMCLSFRENMLYAQITDKAVSFQTMISPDSVKASDGPGDKLSRSVPSHMFSNRTPSKTTGPSNSLSTTRTKTLLAYNDSIPIYDARKIIVDFAADLDRLGQVLPLFHGEIPLGSFVVVGYTCSSYLAAIVGGGDRVPHIGCNILWVIVCGTPGLQPSRAG